MHPLVETLEVRRLLSWVPAVYGTAALERRGWTVIQYQHFTADASREALELVGVHKYILRYDTFAGGSSSLRITDSSSIMLEHDVFFGAIGTPDPDGHDLQFIRTADAIVSRCTLYANLEHTEDILNVFSDKPIAGSVLLEHDLFIGRGPTSSGCSITLDGSSPPDLEVRDSSIRGARCGITIAAGRAILSSIKYFRCLTKFFVANLYGSVPHVVTQ
jgi:hypothetical protein